MTLTPLPDALPSTDHPQWRTVLNVFVPGIPAPGGSKKAFLNPRTGRIVVTDDAKRNKPWRQTVATVAAAAMKRPPVRGPTELVVTFYMPRPKGHFGTGKNAGRLKPGAPIYHTVKPDATKLLRALEDAMTGIVWADDASICQQRVTKVYPFGFQVMDEPRQPGAQIYVTVFETDEERRASGGGL